ncbi:glycosyltransferase [Carboxylicivirga caseinilyticus]|uniref:glycosyltransferase n=1 Tax=Carboxylicivirga caseinilyticus TaxID=3417572 RepID=UPI003D340AFA|nr:glycosyltransferase [Marinilabiliaceae bacterium A049]
MDKLFQKYLSRHSVSFPFEKDDSKKDIRVVIPVYLEEESIDLLLDSIHVAAKKCQMQIELIMVVNYSSDCSSDVKLRQQKLFDYLIGQSQEYTHFSISVIQAYDLIAKHAGVGWARKIGMDYAVSKYADEDNPGGIILSLDADCVVSSNYFTEVWKKFEEEILNGCTICFEHQSEGLNDSQKEAIFQYELHLRYYLQALRWTGHPHAFHTVGSSFAITAEAYVRAGGIPRKQAGEDFYFLQKVISLGSFSELNTTCVYPSSRISDRVPFGTGPTIAKLINDSDDYKTYNLQAFIDLKDLFIMRDKFYKIEQEAYLDLLSELSGRIRSYLLNSDFYADLTNVNNNCSSLNTFNKRFFEVFDAFRVVKYLNYVHEHFLEKTAVFDVSLDLLELLERDADDLMDTNDVLDYFRKWEKQ